MSKIILTPDLANKLKEDRHLDHVIVTSSMDEHPDLTWGDVEKDQLNNSSTTVPTTKLVNDVSLSVRSDNITINSLSGNLDKLSAALSVIQSDTSLLSVLNNISTISSDIYELSTQLSNLFGQNVVKFIGVSETDPATGVITIDNNVYHLSDFNSSNNGNVVYYRKNILNHDGHDQHEPVEAVSMLYAYVYSNGVLNDAGSVAIDANEQPGTFKKYGYAFYENLSTLIHDDMICISAAIQKCKISGLIDDLEANDAYHAILSGRINSISNNVNVLSNSLTAYQLISSSVISVNFLSSEIAGVKSTLSTKIDKSYIANTISSINIGETLYVTSVKAVKDELNNVKDRITTNYNTLNGNIETLNTTMLNTIKNVSCEILDRLSAVLMPEQNSRTANNNIINQRPW